MEPSFHEAVWQVETLSSLDNATLYKSLGNIKSVNKVFDVLATAIQNKEQLSESTVRNLKNLCDRLVLLRGGKMGGAAAAAPALVNMKAIEVVLSRVKECLALQNVRAPLPRQLTASSAYQQGAYHEDALLYGIEVLRKEGRTDISPSTFVRTYCNDLMSRYRKEHASELNLKEKGDAIKELYLIRKSSSILDTETHKYFVLTTEGNERSAPILCHFDPNSERWSVTNESQRQFFTNFAKSYASFDDLLTDYCLMNGVELVPLPHESSKDIEAYIAHHYTPIVPGGPPGTNNFR